MNIDAEKTKLFYEKFEPCLCGDCTYYYNHFQEEQPEICKFLESLGVNPVKPFELISLFFQSEQKMEYCNCMYVVFGSIEGEYEKEINGIKIKANNDCFPDTQIDEDHFLLNFGPVIMQRSYVSYRHLTKEEKIKIIRNCISKEDPIGLLEIGCPIDEYEPEARMIAREIMEKRITMGYDEIIKDVLESQFGQNVNPSVCKRIAKNIMSTLDFNDI
jgi:hypothetical protein